MNRSFKDNSTIDDGISFEEWCAELDAYHEHLRETEEGFQGYGAGSLIAITGSKCWLDYYHDQSSAVDALNEDRSYW